MFIIKLERVYKDIQKVNNDFKLGKISKEEKFLREDKAYVKELLKEDNMHYYEKIIYLNFLRELDNVILSKNIFNPNLVLCKSRVQARILKKQYSNYFFITVEEILENILKVYNIDDYLNVNVYWKALFRVGYRHLYNNKKNFKVEEDKWRDSYIVFTVTNDITYFFKKNILIREKIKPVQKYADELIISTQIKNSKGIPVGNPLQGLDKITVESSFAEFELYNRFLCTLDYHLLIHNMINKNENINLYKRRDDWRKSSRNSYEKTEDKYCNTSIEDILHRAIQDTNLGELLEIDKYIYPCWRMAYHHVSNDEINYEIIGNYFIEENPSLYIRVKLNM